MRSIASTVSMVTSVIMLLLALVAHAQDTCVDVTVTETFWVTAALTSIAPVSSSPPMVPSSAIQPVASISTVVAPPIASSMPVSPSHNATSPPAPLPPVTSSMDVGPNHQVGPSKPAATWNPLPLAAIIETTSPKDFAPLVNQPGFAMVKNSCTYAINLTIDGCGADNTIEHPIAAGETFTEPIRSCPPVGGVGGTGTQLRVTSDAHPKFMLVEYGVDEQDGIFYDLSFLICNKQGSTDMSGCAGWQDGHQCGSGHGCPVFACLPGEYCDRTSYTVHEYGLTAENKAERGSVPAPVGRCQGANHGVVWEVCAGKKRE